MLSSLDHLLSNFCDQTKKVILPKLCLFWVDMTNKSAHELLCVSGCLSVINR